MTYNNRSVGPLKIKDAAYEKSNKKMRSKYKSETGKTLGSRQTTGTNPRRVSFACRFAGMKGPMKDANGEPTRKAMALKKWGFGSVGAAATFCRKHKGKKKSPATYTPSKDKTVVEGLIDSAELQKKQRANDAAQSGVVRAEDL